jgi:hypothetical protein
MSLENGGGRRLLKIDLSKRLHIFLNALENLERLGR